MAFCQNETETTKAIREVKTHCGAAIRKAEACCTTDIREAEAHCVNHAHSIQQLHSNNMEHLERDAMEEEERDCLSFLVTCGAVLQACPLEAHGVLMCPFQLLMGNMFLATVLAIPPQASTTWEEPTPQFPV